MSQPNGLNPSFAGNVKALSFSTPIGTSGTFGGNTMSKVVGTNATTPIDIFGSTIGFTGTLLAAKLLAGDDANGTIDIKGTDGTICRIIKGSAGLTKGCYIRISGVAGTAFIASGTMQASVNNNLNGTGDCLVELIFVSKETEG